ncbi:ParB/RepB/Spo0J family partition protein [Lachnospiraceae bacterium JLR.KK009]|jgi:ParB family chromosome partitioning protein|nr:ParB-like partition protein [Lachnospiraceae bacterium A2]
MAAAKKGGLGKGLDSLISNKVGVIEKVEARKPELDKEVIFVKITKVEPNREQPRKNFDEDSLLELSESIKQHGILQPLLVQDKKDYFEIIAGERRWRAAKMAGMKEIPVIIKKLSDREAVEISLIENIQREDLNPIEEALAFKRLLTEFHLKQDEVAERVSKSRTSVTNSIRLLKLDERVQQMVVDDMISTGHARALLSIEEHEKQYSLAQQIFDAKLSVRETEKLVKKIQNQKQEQPKQQEENNMSLFYEDMEQKLKSIIGTKVAIHYKGKDKGKIEIEYYSNDELERIMDLFQSIH